MPNKRPAITPLQFFRAYAPIHGRTQSAADYARYQARLRDRLLETAYREIRLLIGPQIYAVTRPIECRYTGGAATSYDILDIGPVEMTLSEAGCESITRQNGDDPHPVHPHIYQLGDDDCLGDAEPFFYDLPRRGLFMDALLGIHTFLCGYNGEGNYMDFDAIRTNDTRNIWSGRK